MSISLSRSGSLAGGEIGLFGVFFVYVSFSFSFSYDLIYDV